VPVYVVALWEGGIDGLTSTKFRITGLPSGWTTELLLGPDSMLISGDPFAEDGALVWSFRCLRPTILMTIVITPTSSVEDNELIVQRHVGDPGECFLNRCEPCIKVCGCPDNPECFCASGASAQINGSCSVSLQIGAWTIIKKLFR
jgi:hypothetical protein